jgi:methionyl aminopeptidase
MGFPKSICTSVNDIICHGIPNDQPLKCGDIINIDVTVYLDGFHGDTSDTFPVGLVDPQGLHLIKTTQSALYKGISVCKPGALFSDIGKAISNLVNQHNFTIVRDFNGHGIGQHFHQPPLVMHYENDMDLTMEEGMSFTIEPILCEGSNDYVQWDDNWTVATNDGKRAAQAEHTVLIVRNGVEILTS